VEETQKEEEMIKIACLGMIFYVYLCAGVLFMRYLKGISLVFFGVPFGAGYPLILHRP